jgi:hypothetical protein
VPALFLDNPFWRFFKDIRRKIAAMANYSFIRVIAKIIVPIHKRARLSLAFAIICIPTAPVTSTSQALLIPILLSILIIVQGTTPKNCSIASSIESLLRSTCFFNPFINRDTERCHL